MHWEHVPDVPKALEPYPRQFIQRCHTPSAASALTLRRVLSVGDVSLRASLSWEHRALVWRRLYALQWCVRKITWRKTTVWHGHINFRYSPGVMYNREKYQVEDKTAHAVMRVGRLGAVEHEVSTSYSSFSTHCCCEDGNMYVCVHILCTIYCYVCWNLLGVWIVDHGREPSDAYVSPGKKCFTQDGKG